MGARSHIGVLLTQVRKNLAVWGTSMIRFKSTNCKMLEKNSSLLVDPWDQTKTFDLNPSAFSTSCYQCKENKDEKKIKAIKIKKLHKVNKELFGDLLESSKLKAKRLKKVSSKKINIDYQELEGSLKPTDIKSKLNSSISSRAKHDLSVNEDLKITMIDKRSKMKNLKGDEIHWRLQSDQQNIKVKSQFSKSNPRNNFISELPQGLLGHQPTNKTPVFVPNVTMNAESKDHLSEPFPTVNQLMISLSEDMTAEMKTNVSKNFSLRKSQKVPDSSTPEFSESSLLSSDFSISSYCDPATKQNLNVNDSSSESCSTDLTSIIKTFPFDNPDRIFFEEDRNPLEIISIPFPRVISNPEIISGCNQEKNSLPTRLPSVSRILNATMPKEQVEALEKWQKKMIEKLGEEGFLKYKKSILKNGVELHSNIQSLLSGTSMDQLSISKSISGHWSSLRGILSQIERVHVLESHVAHPHLLYCGIVDCIAVFRDKLVVIDWKTSQKLKPFVSMTYDTPIQIAAYIGAINYDPNYSIKITEGVIAIAYEDGHNSQVFHLNPFEVSRYWKLWLKRLHLYQNQAQLPVHTVTSQTTS